MPARVTFRRLDALLAAAFLTAATLAADAFSPPAGYYDTAAQLTGTALHDALATRTAGHTVRSYNAARDILGRFDSDRQNIPGFPSGTHPRLDVEVDGGTQVNLIYSGRLTSFLWDGGETWNREHIWPQSRGVDSGAANSDLFNLRACNPTVNSTRSNNQFDWSVPGSTGYINLGNNAPWPAAPNLTTRNSSKVTFEPQNPDKGFVARALLYMAVRYNGSDANVPDLVLVENAGNDSSTGPQMGRLSTLLEWNRRFPPSEWERRRNHLIHAHYQTNRNPFIDLPEFADALYAAGNPPTGSTSLRFMTLGRWRQTHFTPTELLANTVSADNQDPDGDNLENLLEYAFNLNPRSPDKLAYPSIQLVQTGGGPEWRVSYRELVDGNVATSPALAGRPPSHGLTYTLQTSNDLVTWSTLTVPAGATRTPDAFNETTLVTFTDTAAPAAFTTHGRRFYRILVTRLF
jgi:endonuclease I